MRRVIGPRYNPALPVVRPVPVRFIGSPVLRREAVKSVGEGDWAGLTGEVPLCDVPSGRGTIQGDHRKPITGMPTWTKEPEGSGPA